MSVVDNIVSIRLDDANDALVLLDQTLLPNETKYIVLKSAEQIFEAISLLRVRGAPAIGITAAYGVYLCTKHVQTDSYEEFAAEFKKVKDYLASSRPTAVNLFWALNRMEEKLESVKDLPIAEIKTILRDEAQAIRDEDEAMCREIGENALSLLKPGMGLLTHCNAGTIATARYGTAQAPFHLGQERGYNFKAYVDETRPLLQGSRLTAWELQASGVDVTLVCDNMVSQLMRNGWIDACLVGCDRVAANGDTANKIGTATLSIVAKHYGIPVYVCGPTTTIDMDCPTGDDIEIELRKESEISELWYEKRMAPEGIKAYNPAFDVTPNELITAIVTDRGIVYPPFDVNLAKIMKDVK
ncbi:MAG: S-methyl-5-thioribose-1-phosphate isomerase [Bacillota bacterium]|nr:S-methyl-5-thioribose-1-phosphate isomerase [Bacillota bacterium]HHU61734.1 S-methyl-5-thioribose-1-phosphate isomerase [Natronincola sp.]